MIGSVERRCQFFLRSFLVKSLNATSKSLLQWAPIIALIVYAVAISLYILIPFFFVKKHVYRYNPESWPRIRLPLIAALLVLLGILYYWLGDTFMLASTSTINTYGPIIETIIILLMSIAIFCVSLWYIGKLSFAIIRSYLLGLLIGSAVFFGSTIGTQFLFEAILKTDPAYVMVLEAYKERQEKLANEFKVGL
jgi:hypothetical protein